MVEDYTRRFATQEAVTEYLNLYDEDAHNYANVLHRIELTVLDSLLEPVSTGDLEYLDFATGTGRIIAHLEARFASSTGIDISPQMIAACSKRSSVSRLRCEDITSTSPDAQYDVITAFRFFLNANAELRVAVLCAIRDRLKPGGKLVVNNHGRFAGVNFLRAIRSALGRKTKQNVMTDKSFETMFTAVGFSISGRRYYGVLGGKLGKLLGYDRSMRIERKLLGGQLARWLGTCVIYEFRLPH